MKYSKQALAHLKYNLINKKGLSVAQAEKRIDKLIKFTAKVDKKTKDLGKKRNKKEAVKCKNC